MRNPTHSLGPCRPCGYDLLAPFTTCRTEASEKLMSSAAMASHVFPPPPLLAIKETIR